MSPAIDYGVRATTTKLEGPDVAAKFLTEVKKLAPSIDVIPVWTTECELEDMALEKEPKHEWTTGYCGEVDCFNYCLDRFTEQWTALHTTHQGPTAILVLHKEFRRSSSEYGSTANWVKHVVRYLDKKQLSSVPRHKLWLIVQGYDVEASEEKAARQTALQSGVGAVLVARTRIDQSYEPRLMSSK
jgi:hypothetical protein